MSHVLKTKSVSLPRVLEGAWSGGEGLVGEGRVGRFEGGGGHAAEGEAQCPGDCHQQHLERRILGTCVRKCHRVMS